MKRTVQIIILGSAIALAGCQRPDAQAPVLAKVNGAEILAGEVGSPQALEHVIDRELLVQKALEARLDHEPAVAQALEDARRQILAQAWLERRAGGAGMARPEEVSAFYAENPTLFAERRIYRLRELAVAAAPSLIETLRAEAPRLRDLDEVGAWLRLHGAPFRPAGSVQPAEQLPLSHLPRVARMRPGEITVLDTPEGASVVQLVDAQEAPLSERDAAPMIESFLAGRKRLEMAAAEVKRLRGIARIEYVGDFKTR